MIEFVSLDRIDPNPFQPRATMDAAGIADLAADIHAKRDVLPETLGLLQTPRGRRHDERVQLAYGHRRLAAFQLLVTQGHYEYGQFPIELAEFSDVNMATIAWSENAVRQDIDVMEETRFVIRLMDEFGWTLVKASTQLGIPYATLNKNVRLINLPPEVQAMIAAGEVTAAQGSDLCGLLGRVSDEEIIRLARTGKQKSVRDWQKHVTHAHFATAVGLDLVDHVIDPATRVLAEALTNDEPGAWLIVARAIDPKSEVDGAGDLARLIIERVVNRAQSTPDGKKRINTLFEPAGLVPPWNVHAVAKVNEFLAWKKKKRARAA